MSKYLLYFENTPDSSYAYNYLRKNKPKKIVPDILEKFHGDPTTLIKGAIDLSLEKKSIKASGLLNELKDHTRNKNIHPPEGGFEYLYTEVVANLLTHYAFMLINIGNKYGIDQHQETFEAVSTLCSRSNLARTNNLMQAGYPAYIEYVSKVDPQFANPDTFAYVFMSNLLNI